MIASTFSSNLVSTSFGSGGIFTYGKVGSAMLQIGDSILKAGSLGANIGNNLGTIISLGYKLSSDNGGGFLTGVGDQVNADPLLGPLQDNGGPTPTMLPLAGSPAIDQGRSFGQTTDQRGQPRPFDNPAIPNASAGDGSDIGAVEVQPPATFLVLNANDSGSGSLRQAISDNNATAGGNSVIFSNVVTGTITLTSGQLLISKDLTLIGPGANVLAVNGNHASRVFYVTNAAAVSISGLTISNGLGGIFNDHSTLTIRNCTISCNSASGGGGGIDNFGESSGSATLAVIAKHHQRQFGPLWRRHFQRRYRREWQRHGDGDRLHVQRQFDQRRGHL